MRGAFYNWNPIDAEGGSGSAQFEANRQRWPVLQIEPNRAGALDRAAYKTNPIGRPPRCWTIRIAYETSLTRADENVQDRAGVPRTGGNAYPQFKANGARRLPAPSVTC